MAGSMNSQSRGVQVDALSSPMAQYSLLGPPTTGMLCTYPTGAGAEVFGVVQEYVNRDNASVSCVTQGDTYAIAGAAITIGAKICCEGADGKIKMAVPSAAIVQSGNDNNFTVTGKGPLYGSEEYSFEVRLNSTASAAAKFEVEGTHIIYYPATTTTPAITGTLADMITALASDAEALALIGITITGSDGGAGTGAGNMAAVPTTPLTGGGNAFGRALQAASGENSIILITID
jgi:hypothetical protein